jgi:hypothetical protein
VHDLVGILIESVASAFTGGVERSRGWLYVIGFFALLAVVAALVTLFTRLA